MRTPTFMLALFLALLGCTPDPCPAPEPLPSESGPAIVEVSVDEEPPPPSWHTEASENGFAMAASCERPSTCSAPPCDCPPGCAGGWCESYEGIGASEDTACGLMAGKPVCWYREGYDFRVPDGEGWSQLLKPPYGTWDEDLCGLRLDGTSTCPGVGDAAFLQGVGGPEWTENGPGYFFCGIRADDRTVECTGARAATQPPLVGTFMHLAPMNYHSGNNRLCGVHTNGELECVGDGGTPSFTGSFVQVVTSHTGPIATCGLRRNGTVACEGIPSPSGAYTQIAIGPSGDTFRLCAINADHQLSCWLNGEEENNHSGSYVSVALASNTGCALAPDGTVDCFRHQQAWNEQAFQLPWEGPGDNCPAQANGNQSDWDDDGVGDKCEDSDGDGINDLSDNCPGLASPYQTDCNGDGIGDVCSRSLDTDGDGHTDECDNCPTVANPGQENTENTVCLGGATYCDGRCQIEVSAGLTCAEICPANPDQALECPIAKYSNGTPDTCGRDDTEEVYVGCEEPPPEDLNTLTCICDWATDGIGDACDTCPETANHLD